MTLVKWFWILYIFIKFLFLHFFHELFALLIRLLLRRRVLRTQIERGHLDLIPIRFGARAAAALGRGAVGNAWLVRHDFVFVQSLNLLHGIRGWQGALFLAVFAVHLSRGRQLFRKE